jgi:hypothetical protein
MSAPVGKKGYAKRPALCVVILRYLVPAMTLRAATDNFAEPRVAAAAQMQMTVISS